MDSVDVVDVVDGKLRKSSVVDGSDDRDVVVTELLGKLLSVVDVVESGLFPGKSAEYDGGGSNSS